MPINGHRFNLEIRSEEVQEILTKMPHWTIRWGTVLIFCIILLILLASWFIKYPERLNSQILLTTEIPPARIISRSTGRVDFFVSNEETVASGKLLAVIQNPAETDDILKLMQWMEGVDNPINAELPSESMALGEIQLAYSGFIQSIKEERTRIGLDEFDRRKKTLQSRIRHFEKLNRQLDRQILLMEEEVAIVKKNFGRQQELFRDQVVAELELDNARNELLRIERQLESLQTNKINNDIQISSLNEQLLQAEIKFSEDEGNYKGNIEQTFRQLKSEIERWKEKYWMESPIDGKVTFLEFWQDRQFVEEGAEVMAVIPENQQIFGKVLLPVGGSGEVKIGQKAQIRFANYPNQEYGIVLGRVKNIALVPRNDNYLVTVELPDGLKTSYDLQLEFHQEMKGTAEIITEEMRLIEKVFFRLKSAIDQV